MHQVELFLEVCIPLQLEVHKGILAGRRARTDSVGSAYTADHTKKCDCCSDESIFQNDHRGSSSILSSPDVGSKKLTRHHLLSSGFACRTCHGSACLSTG